jgi:hypothetical protein
MAEDPKAFYRAMSTDELASTALQLKEQMDGLRTVLWFIEDELRDRLTANNAKHLMGDAFRVKSSLKRNIVFDQAALGRARQEALIAGHRDLFDRAFPLKFDCSVANMNTLLKLGGKTAEAIESAKVSVSEKVYLTYDCIPDAAS